MLDLLTSSYAEVLRSARKPSVDARPYRIGILTDSTVAPIEPFLTVLGSDIGLQVSFAYADPATTIPDSFASGTGSHVFDEVDCIIVLLSLRLQAPDLHDRAAHLSSQRQADMEGHVTDMMAAALTALRKQSSAPILWFSFAEAEPVLTNLTTSHGRSVSRLNQVIRDRLANTNDAYLLDFSTCLARLGYDNAFDMQRARNVSVLYRPAAFREIALESFKYIRAFTGNTKKCLVLDCDGTLWGGTVGEDGIENLVIGQDGSQSPHLALQRTALDLRDAGVLLALCSKNDEAAVWQVFDQREDMLLRREHFAAHQINWNDKPTNLRSLAAQLNIGLNSLVFADDSAFETSMVEKLAPQIVCLTLDPATLHDFRGILGRLGWFATPSIATHEDQLRAQSYQHDRQRDVLHKASATVEEYLRSLSMNVRIRKNADIDLVRAEQLCRRTNQFNLTLNRHSSDAIARFAADANSDVFMLSVSDAVGDLGSVGLAIVNHRQDDALIDTFLLSCRAFGRGLEDVLLACCADQARQRGAARLVGTYIAGPRNALVADFYKNREFKPYQGADGDAFALYPLAFAAPDHFASIAMPSPQGEPVSAGIA